MVSARVALASDVAGLPAKLDEAATPATDQYLATGVLTPPSWAFALDQSRNVRVTNWVTTPAAECALCRTRADNLMQAGRKIRRRVRSCDYPRSEQVVGSRIA